MTKHQTVAAALRARRMTQTELAAAAGLSLPYVNDIIHGRTPLSVRAALRLGRALDTDPRTLLIAQLDRELAALEDVS